MKLYLKKKTKPTERIIRKIAKVATARKKTNTLYRTKKIYIRIFWIYKSYSIHKRTFYILMYTINQ